MLRTAAVLAEPADESTLLIASGLTEEASRGLAEALASGLLHEDDRGMLSYRHMLACRV